MDDKKIVKSFHIQDELNPDIWMESEGRYVMKPEIREKLLEIGGDFMDFLDVGLGDCEVDTKDCDVEDITVTGSLANYNWSDYSDIDLHVIVDFGEFQYDKELLKNYFNSKKTIWNSQHDVTIYGYEVEVYAQDDTEEHFSSGVYSVLYDEWIVEPQQEEFDLDEKVLLKKASPWMEMIDDLYEKSKNIEFTDTIDLVRKVKDKLKKYRTCGLEKGGEYSYENLVFKLLRRNGYIKKLLDLRNDMQDELMSIK